VRITVSLGISRSVVDSAFAGLSEYAGVLPHIAAEIRARLRQTERAAHLLGKAGVGSVSVLLAIATKYPAAASLHEHGRSRAGSRRSVGGKRRE